MLTHWISTLRVKHWVKNLVIFAGLIFSKNVFHAEQLGISFLAFVAFCLNSSSAYIINDLKDLKADQLHPTKRLRPLAAGLLKPATAIWMSLLLAVLSLALAFGISLNFGLLVTVYWVMMVAYSCKLKHVVIVDIIVISTGFVLRAVSGAIVIDVMISRWLWACTIFLALFMVLAKRRHEIMTLGENASAHRMILVEYGERFLDQMIAVVTGCTIISYVLYAVDPDTIAKFDTNRLIWTVPFVIYGIFRYLYLVYQRNLGGQPEKIVLQDTPLLVCIFLWVCAVVLIIYQPLGI